MSYQFTCPECGRDHGRSYEFCCLTSSRLCERCEGKSRKLDSFTKEQLVDELCKRDGVYKSESTDWYVPYESIILVVKK